MTAARRVLIGTLLGAFLAILIHPDARNLVADGLRFGPSKGLSQSLISSTNFERLPQPDSQATRRLWLDAGSQRVLRRLALGNDDLGDLVKVAKSAAEIDPGNAFWLQLEAALVHASGSPASALSVWKRAATYSRWVDNQDRVLVDTVKEIGGSNPRAWHYAAVLWQRSDSPASLIASYSRELSRSTSLNGTAALSTRMAILRNGDLIRRGAKTVANGEAGVKIVEIATFPPDVPTITSPRRLLIARSQLTNNLSSTGKDLDSQIASRGFRANDGWTALIFPEAAQEQTRWLTVEALAVSCFLGASVSAGLVGAALYLTGQAIEKFERSQLLFQPWVMVPLSLVVGWITYLLTGILFAAVGLTASLLGLTYRPKKIRVRGEFELTAGPTVVLALIAGILCLLWIFYFAGLSTPGWELASALDLPSEYYEGSPVVLSLIALISALALLASPLLSLAYRLDPRLVIGTVLQRLGKNMVGLSLTLVLVGIVPMMTWHANLNTRLKEMVLHEPLHYLGSK